MNIPLAALLAASLALAAPSPPRTGSLTVTDGWVWAVAPGVPDTSAFVTLRNTAKTAVRVVGGSTAVAGMVMPMKTTRKGQGASGMSGMSNTDTLTVPPGGSLTLRPDGEHLMLMGLKRPLRPGERIDLTLKTSAGAVTVPLTVKKP